MKFKAIFVLFNITLIFACAFIVLMPIIVLDEAFSAVYLARSWPLVAFFALLLAGFDVFFAMNWKLFTLLEAERWQDLSVLLGAAVFKSGRLDRRTIRLLVNTSLLLGDTDTVQRLEALLRDKKPEALRRDAALFGAARLLRNDPAASVAFLAEYAGAQGVERPGWVSFQYGFSLILDGRAAEATSTLAATAGSREPVLALLSAYLLGTLCARSVPASERDALVARADSVRTTIAARYGRGRWEREVNSAKSEVHIVIVSRLLDEAGRWMEERA